MENGYSLQRSYRFTTFNIHTGFANPFLFILIPDIASPALAFFLIYISNKVRNFMDLFQFNMQREPTRGLLFGSPTPFFELPNFRVGVCMYIPYFTLFFQKKKKRVYIFSANIFLEIF